MESVSKGALTPGSIGDLALKQGDISPVGSVRELRSPTRGGLGLIPF